MWKNRFFWDYWCQNEGKNVKKIWIFKKNTMNWIVDFHHKNGDFEFLDAKKWKFGKKITLETHFGTYWPILEKSIFLPPKIGQSGWFTVKMAPSNGSKKTKNRSKHSVFRYFRLKIGFYFSRGCLPSHTAGTSLKSRKTKKLGRFFGKK